MNIRKTGAEKPIAMLIYGPDGKGKTTMASHFPNPILLGPEIEGADFITGLDVDEDSKTYDGLMDSLNWLLDNDHGYKTVVVDSLDHVELELHQKIKTKYKVDNLNKAAGGFGGGYKEAAQMQYDLKERLMRLRKEKGMNVFLIAHDQKVTENTPLTEEPFTKHVMKLHESASVSPRSMWRESVDAVFFLNNKLATVGEGKGVRGKTSEEVYAFTYGNTSYNAKCRFPVPKEIEFKLDKNFFETVKSYAFSGKVDQYEMAMQLYNSLKKPDENILKFIEENKDDQAKLVGINNRLKEMI